MPEDGGSPPDARTVVVMSERMAIVETQLKQLISDLAVIRAAGHVTAAELQKLVGFEVRIGDRLDQLMLLTRDLPTIAAQAHSFTEMKDRITEVLDDRQRRKGERNAVVLMGSLLVGAVTIGGAIAGGLMWLVGKAEVPYCPVHSERTLHACLRWSYEPCTASCPHKGDWLGPEKAA